MIGRSDISKINTHLYPNLSIVSQLIHSKAHPVQVKSVLSESNSYLFDKIIILHSI